MPVYTVVKAKPGESIPYHVFDATGREWLYCCRVDTESGEITRYVMDENGFPVLDEGGLECKRETVNVPAPLLITYTPEELACANSD